MARAWCGPENCRSCGLPATCPAPSHLQGGCSAPLSSGKAPQLARLQVVPGRALRDAPCNAEESLRAGHGRSGWLQCLAGGRAGGRAAPRSAPALTLNSSPHIMEYDQDVQKSGLAPFSVQRRRKRRLEGAQVEGTLARNFTFLMIACTSSLLPVGAFADLGRRCACSSLAAATCCADTWPAMCENPPSGELLAPPVA